jgi:predicted kinase
MSQNEYNAQLIARGIVESLPKKGLALDAVLKELYKLSTGESIYTAQSMEKAYAQMVTEAADNAIDAIIGSQGLPF